MPVPWSRTATATPGWRSPGFAPGRIRVEGRATISMGVPSAPYLSALSRRFWNTCTSSSASPRTGGSSPARSKVKRMLRPLARGSSGSAAWRRIRSIAIGSVGARCSFISMRDSDSRSSTSRVMRARFLAIMAEQGARMTRLVEDLLSLSRIEMNEHRAPTEPIAIDLILRQAAEPLEPRAKGRNMRFTFDLAGELPPVLGDADELVQVFQNLLDNALKYGAEGTPIEIVVRPSTRILPGAKPGERYPGVAVAVRDHGTGIAREHLPRLTERFYRVDAARSRALGGTGLGLAIVKHIVSHHRGAFEIDSEPDQGSVFTVHLPAAFAKTPAETGI